MGRRVRPDGAETWVPVAIGCVVLAQSLLTAYEWGAGRVIPMPTHLMLAFGAGGLLAASPWLFGFSEYVWAPHLAVGLLEMGAALTTETAPAAAGAPAAGPARRHAV